MSFRLRETEAALLHKDQAEHPVSGIESLKQFIRKLSVDYALGRLVYVQPVDRAIDFDSRDYLPVAPPDCQISDRKFLKVLRDFISIPENWHKLRLFMLRTGWPEKLKAEFRDAKNDQERLFVAQKLLAQMLIKNHPSRTDHRQSNQTAS